MTKVKGSTLFFFILIIMNYFLIRKFWFHSDDWFWFTTLSKDFQEILTLRYSEIHLVAIPGFIYKSILTFFGINSYPFFQIALLAVNFGILLTLFKILRKETRINSTFIVLILAVWYTNSWGRENIRWPQAITTNLSLLSFLVLFFFIRTRKNHLTLWVPMLTTLSICSSSWSFAYLPFILGTILDSTASLRTRMKLISLLIFPALVGITYIFIGAENSFGTKNYLNIFLITVLSPVFAFVAWAPWGSFDFLFSLNFVTKITIAAVILRSILRIPSEKPLSDDSQSKFMMLGLITSLFTFGLTIAVGRSSGNVLIPLSSRFSFILTLLFLLIFLFQFNDQIIEISNQQLMKLALCILLIFQILLLNRDLNKDFEGEKWERIEFNKQVSLDRSGGRILESCCKMDPGVDKETYEKIFTLTKDR